LAESFLVNITGVELVRGSVGAGQPSLRRPGMEVAEITIQENDDPRGVLQFNLSKDSPVGVLAYEMPPPDNILHLSVVRLAGTIGRLVAYWEAQPITADLRDFTPVSGNTTFQDGQVVISEPEFVDDPAAVATLTVLRSPGVEEDVGHILIPVVAWNILGPNSRDPLPALNTDFRAPVSGSFFFKDGEESMGIIELRILPHGEVEMEETFVIELSILSGEMDVDPQAGSVTLKVHWQIQSDSDTVGDFLALAGSVMIVEGQREAEIILSLMPDSVPELEELYIVQLTAVDGGGTLDANPDLIRTQIRVPANDEPHGVFSLNPKQQSVVVVGSGSQVTRALVVNVTRLAGLFGNASVGYKISGRGTEVGFASLGLQVLSVEMGTCEAKVTRTGLFGSVTLAHGEKTKSISFTAFSDGLQAATYAIHLTNATSGTGGPGAVKLRSCTDTAATRLTCPTQHQGAVQQQERIFSLCQLAAWCLAHLSKRMLHLAFQSLMMPCQSPTSTFMST
ncbi:hypothetical protein XENOCAPTIV_014496, partial [Xenoophorus captivus]